MAYLAFNRSTHSGRLERWLGVEKTEQLSRAVKDWYGPPIAVGGVPGSVWACKGGDFRGPIAAGRFANYLDFQRDKAKRAYRRWLRAQLATANAGFASFSELISEQAAGKGRSFHFNKVGTTGVTSVTNSLWRLGPVPAVGSAPAAAPGGTVFDDASTGGFPFSNPTGGDTQHFIKGEVSASVASNTLLLYDLIFGVNKTMASTATEAVTGVPTRYQSTTPGAMDYAAGNFLFVQVGGTALAATAHNWTACLYTDQDGNASATLPSLTGAASAIVDRLDHPVMQWFAPLASGDIGIKALTQMQCSASVASGVIWFMMGHPIAFMPCPIVGIICLTDGLKTAFNLVRIFDDACLAFLEINKPSTTATTYTGSFHSVAS